MLQRSRIAGMLDLQCTCTEHGSKSRCFLRSALRAKAVHMYMRRHAILCAARGTCTIPGTQLSPSVVGAQIQLSSLLFLFLARSFPFPPTHKIEVLDGNVMMRWVAGPGLQLHEDCIAFSTPAFYMRINGYWSPLHDSHPTLNHASRQGRRYRYKQTRNQPPEQMCHSGPLLRITSCTPCPSNPAVLRCDVMDVMDTRSECQPPSIC
ncbi:hypothetical protein V8C43DRAFT_70317 [Trichoderma afarasin]